MGRSRAKACGDHEAIAVGESVKPLIKTTGRRIYRAGLRVLEARIDRRLHIDTSEAAPRQAHDPQARNAPYEPAPYVALKMISRRLGFGPGDVICDAGCGKGRALCWFATLPVARCIGVDIDPALIDIARRNGSTLLGRQAPIEARAEDALTTDMSGVTVLFLFNPFGAEVMRGLLDNFRASLLQAPRDATIIYLNPVQLAVFEDYPEFRIVERFNYLFGLLPTASGVVMRRAA